MNVVYIVAPDLTVGSSSVAAAFLAACEPALQEFGSVSTLSSFSAIRMAEPGAADVLVLFNRSDESYDESVLNLIRRSLQSGAGIIPVAASAHERTPPALIRDKQSFDVVEHLRQRGLKAGQVATVAIVLARQVMSTLKPTLCAQPMQLFLSYRRFDGEDITARFDSTLRVSAQKLFRDLLDVRVGEDAQEVIEARLRESEAVVFLDTPQAGGSRWIANELQTALALQIPIVWVRIGQEESRVPLSIQPSGEPHFFYAALDPRTDTISAEEAEKIVQKAFQVHHRDYVDRLLDEFEKLKDLAPQLGITLTEVDQKRMVFSLAVPRKANRYRERPLTHLIQLFGRLPTKTDLTQFPACAKTLDYEPHPKHGPHYDSAILLAAIPSQPEPLVDDCGVHTDSIGDYVAELERKAAPASITRTKRLVISGAFADCEPEFQQNLTNAVHAVVESSLRAGLAVTFGAHPTFQFMIFDIARRLRPDDYLSALRMYISRFFVTEAAIDEFRRNAEVIPTLAKATRAASLTVMRKAMLGDGESGALVVIGGKTARGGHSPGIDEEIALAREAGLSVFIFGSVGGRSSEISATMPVAERNSMNRLSDEANDELATSLDYSRLSSLIVSSL